MDDNRLWLATEFGGIAVLDLTQRLFVSSEDVRFNYIKASNDEYGLSSSSVRCLFQDSFNNIWAGTWGGGINFLSRDSSLFNVYNYSPIPTAERNLTDKMISTVCVDQDGVLWIGTNGGDINVFQREKSRYIWSG